MAARRAAYLLLGDIRYISRARKQVAALHAHDVEVQYFNGTFGQSIAYGKGDVRPAWIARIPESGSRLLNFIALLKFNRAAAQAILLSNPDVVICRELSTLPAGAWIKRARPDIRLIFDNNELSVETFSGIKKPIWRRLESRCLPYCDAVIHAERNRMALYLKSYANHGRHVVVENYPEFNHAAGHRRTRDDTVKAVYFGAIMPSRGMEQLIAGFIAEPQATLDIIGFGPADYVSALRERVPAAHRDRICFLPAISDTQMYGVLSHYDVGIAFYPATSGLNNVYCAPNKVYQYLQAGLAILTTSNPGLKELVDRHQVGVCLDDLSPGEIRRGILRIRNDALYRNVSEEVRRLYSWESVLPTFLSVVDKPTERS